jgi:hypothetical protein
LGMFKTARLDQYEKCFDVAAQHIGNEPLTNIKLTASGWLRFGMRLVIDI